MGEKPISVAVGVVFNEGNVLLITRLGGAYQGMWGIPGGKIEVNEHVGDAAVRELLEETGIKTTFSKHVALISEHLVENRVVEKHFLLHLCLLSPITTNTSQQEGEGKPQWFPLSNLSMMRDMIIPSDYLMIERAMQQSGPTYIECVIEKEGDTHTIKKFG